MFTSLQQRGTIFRHNNSGEAVLPALMAGATIKSLEQSLMAARIIWSSSRADAATAAHIFLFSASNRITSLALSVLLPRD
jgi:hypothetical protein